MWQLIYCNMYLHSSYRVTFIQTKIQKCANFLMVIGEATDKKIL